MVYKSRVLWCRMLVLCGVCLHGLRIQSFYHGHAIACSHVSPRTTPTSGMRFPCFFLLPLVVVYSPRRRIPPKTIASKWNPRQRKALKFHLAGSRGAFMWLYCCVIMESMRGNISVGPQAKKKFLAAAAEEEGDDADGDKGIVIPKRFIVVCFLTLLIAGFGEI